MKKILAWHWVRDNCTLLDGSPLEIGQRLVHKGNLKMCKSGYHASLKALDTLHYALGQICCRVEVGGEIILDTDKLVASERTALWAIDATEVLRSFARWCALEVVHLWNAPEVVRKYLETGREELQVATWSTTWSTAWSTEWNASGSAEWNASGSAAKAAAMAAWAARGAGAAIWAARGAGAATWGARGAAKDAAKNKQNIKLEEMLMAQWEEEWKP